MLAVPTWHIRLGNFPLFCGPEMWPAVVPVYIVSPPIMFGLNFFLPAITQFAERLLNRARFLTGPSIELRFVSKRGVISFGFLFNEVLNAVPQYGKTLRCFQPVFVVFVPEACVRLCTAHGC